MLAPFKQLLCEYKCIVMNMSNDLPINLVVSNNYELLCDVGNYNGTNVHVVNVGGNVMHVCMVSYMTVDYGHTNHAFKVNVCS